MDAFNKKRVNELLDSDLVIHWWNFRSKTLDFKGTVREYLKKNNVTYTIRAYKDEHRNFETLKIKVKMSIGNLKDLQFTCHDLEDVIRMVINIRLSYLCDKSQFSFNGRTRTINF